MQITTRALVAAVALLASAPLLAASPGTSTAGTHASTQETTEQDDCTLSTLSSTDLSAGLAGLLPRPGTPDTADVDRRLGKAVSCERPLSLRWNDEPQDSAWPKLGTAWPRQGSFLEGSRGADDLSVVQSHF
jgi:hypothetical protein